MNNVIDAMHRFPQSNEGRQKVTSLDRLRQSPRTDRADAILLAVRLGEIAQKLAPERPKDIAKRWFESLWQGERWDKRKRYILFQGEEAPVPIASNGADWAALIEQAATSLYPDDNSTAIKERARVSRDVLRGTSFLPAAQAIPFQADSAQSLMSMLVAKVCDRIEGKSELSRLWEVLNATPFDIQPYDFVQTVYSDDELENPIIAAMRGTERFDGDAYSLGPLGNAAKLAVEVSQFRFRQSDYGSYRFEPRNKADLDEWPIPIVRLGLVGHRREDRIFVIPQDFISDLPIDQEFEDGGKLAEERVFEWLVLKEIIPAKTWQSLPDIEFSDERGYGWKKFKYDLARPVWLEIRPRGDGSPGLWLSSLAPDFRHCYPRGTGIDTLATEALAPIDHLDFLAMSIEDQFYDYLAWPSDAANFLPNGEPPEGAVSGLLLMDAPELPDIEGWLDDRQNLELQEFLFRRPSDRRFCPSIAVDDELPPPCEAGTIAAAIFANAGAANANRIANQLIEQAAVISENGLGFHAALLDANRRRIDAMLSD